METFVIRVWAPADATERDRPAAPVKGRLEHVTSGRRVVFRGIDELGTLIVRELRRTSTAAGEPGEREG